MTSFWIVRNDVGQCLGCLNPRDPFGPMPFQVASTSENERRSTDFARFFGDVDGKPPVEYVPEFGR